jgi:hypothetical protein
MLQNGRSRLSKQCGILNISQCYRPPQPDTGIGLLYFTFFAFFNRFCGLEVTVPGYRSRGPVSIPGAVRFLEK